MSISLRHRERSEAVNHQSGQTALEFMIVISIVLILFAAFFTIFSRREIEAVNKETRLRAKEIADLITYNLDLALVQGAGFSKQFMLPANLGTSDYQITINQTGQGSVVFISWSDQFVTSYTAASQINGSLDPGSNQISNRGGALSVN